VGRAFGWVRQPWGQMLAVGLALFLLVTQAAKSTENPNYYPSIIVLGAFLAPMVFVTWVYGRTRPSFLPLPPLAVCFTWGGIVGTVIAGVLEYETLRDLGPFALLGVGFIEESAKLVAPLIVFLRWRHRSEADGVVFGVASGMGFAAFETMGYAFVALIESKGSIGVLEMTLFMRGLLSPAGHGAWTGLVCAVLWRERERHGRVAPNHRVILAFLGAVLLHALWDTANSLTGVTLIENFGIELVSLVIAVASLWLLSRRIHEVDRARARSVPASAVAGA